MEVIISLIMLFNAYNIPLPHLSPESLLSFTNILGLLQAIYLPPLSKLISGDKIPN